MTKRKPPGLKAAMKAIRTLDPDLARRLNELGIDEVTAKHIHSALVNDRPAVLSIDFQLGYCLRNALKYGGIDRGALKTIAPALSAAAKWGGANMLNSINYSLLKKRLPQEALEPLAAYAVDAAAKDIDPDFVVRPLIEGLGSKLISQKSLPAYAKSVTCLFHDLKKDGVFAYDLDYYIRTGMRDRTLSRRTLEMVKPLIIGTLKSGHSATLLMRALNARGASGMRAQHLHAVMPHLETEVRAGRDPGRLFGAVTYAFKSGLGPRALPLFMEHLGKHAGHPDLHVLAGQAALAHKKGVPWNKVFKYQDEFLRKGHLPMAQAMADYHKIVTKRKKRG